MLGVHVGDEMTAHRQYVGRLGDKLFGGASARLSGVIVMA